jgi:FMN-dependent NADH-azoreductase
MPTLLHIDSSPLYGRSVSRRLTGTLVTEWKSSHPDGRVVYRDLNAAQIPAFLAPHLQAVQTHAQTFLGGHA